MRLIAIFISAALLVGLAIFSGSFGFNLTGYTVVSFSEASDFSSGTFNGTYVANGNVKLNKTLTPVADFIDLDYPNFTGWANQLDIQGDYLYLTSFQNDSLTIFNISNRTNPIPVGVYNNSAPPYSLDGAWGIDVKGDYAFVSAQVDDTITIINISDPTNPSPVGGWTPGIYLDNNYWVSADENYDYIYIPDGFLDRFYTLNVTDKSNPVNISEYRNLASPYSSDNIQRIYVDGDYAYLTPIDDSSLVILNITDRTNQTGVGEYTNLEPPYPVYGIKDVSVSGNYAYLLASFRNALTILDISDKSNPVAVGQYIDDTPPYSLDGAETIEVAGDYVYASSTTDDSLTIIDVDNKSNPIPVVSYENSDPPYSLDLPFGFSVLEQYVYVAARTDNSLTILDASHNSSGTYESGVIDAGSVQKWDSISWDSSQPSGTNISIAYRSCDDSACSGENYSNYTSISPKTLSVSNNRYFQFKANLTTTNLSTTPKLSSVDITHSTPSAAPSDDEDDSNTGGGGGLPTFGEDGTPSVVKTNIIVSVKPGEEARFTKFEGTGIKEVSISVKSEISDVRIKVSAYDSKPSTVSKEISKKAYKYLEINADDFSGNIEKASVKFSVDKSWVLDNGLDKEDITIYKFDENAEKWNELDAVYDREENAEYVYSVEINSFSYFAVGEKAKISIVSDITDSVVESYDAAKQTKMGFILWWAIFTILLFGIFMIGFLILRQITGIQKGREEYESIKNSSTFLVTKS